MVGFAAGSYAHTVPGTALPPIKAASQALCKAQMIPLPSGYQNFSLPGVLIILAVGGLIIFCGYSIDVVVCFIQRKWLNRPYAWLAWKLDAQLQLHRLAQENAGWGLPWARQLDSAPAAHPGTSLGIYEECVSSPAGDGRATLRRASMTSSDGTSSLMAKRSAGVNIERYDYED